MSRPKESKRTGVGEGNGQKWPQNEKKTTEKREECNATIFTNNVCFHLHSKLR